MYKNLLVATDGSKLSDKALAHAIALAQAVGARLTVFYAAPDYPMPAYADGIVYEMGEPGAGLGGRAGGGKGQGDSGADSDE